MRVFRFRLATPIIAVAMVIGLTLVAPGAGNAQMGGGDFISRDVAVVNGDILTEKELLFTLIRLFGKDTISDLIEDEVIVSQAGVLGVSLEPNQVAQYLAGAYAPEKLAALIDAFGENLLSRTVGNQLLALETVTSKIDRIVAENGLEITDEQVEDVYRQGLPLWTTPASVRFSLIEVATQAEAEAARQRILGGESFDDVCREVSTHAATREYGGDIGGLVPKGYSTGERAVLETTAFDLGIGQVSTPLQVEGKWYLVMPTEKTEYREPTLEEMHDYLHASLLDELVQPYLEAWMSDLFDRAQVEVSYPILLENPPSQFIPGANGSFIAPTVAVVNGRDIPEGALFFHLLRQYGSDGIESMIEEMLYVQEGSGMGVSVTTDEARQELARIYEPAVLRILDSAFGAETLNSTVIRHMVALEVEGTRWQEIIDQQDIEVTDAQVTQYYLENLEKWVRPEMVRFSMIVVQTQAEADAARLRITNGESFETVCSAVSIDDKTRQHGGDIGASLPRGFAGSNSSIEQAAFTVPISGVSQPVQVGSNWFLIKVTDKTDAVEPTLGEKREEIYATLLRERVAPFLNGWRSSLWEAADIRVVYPIYAENPTPDFSSTPSFLPEG